MASICKAIEEKQKISLNKETEKFDSITIRASGNAIRKAIILVEDIKQKIGNLYQTNTIHTMTVVDEWQPKYIGLEVLK